MLCGPNMRIHNPLDDVFGTALSVRILRALMLSPGDMPTSRALALRVGASTSQSIRTLNRLEQIGLVSAKAVGKAIVWSVVPDHVLSTILTDVFVREAGVSDQLNETIAAWAASQPIRSVGLFGSVARGDETLTSDIDVHVVTDSATGKTQVDASAGELTVRVARRFGNPLSLLIHDPATLERLRASPLVVALHKEEQRLKIPRHG